MIKNFKKYILKKIKSIYENKLATFFIKKEGYCPCCDMEVIFKSNNHWLRDHFKCDNCNSIPRERALMLTIEQQYPNWKELKIHESSPGKRGHSLKLKKQCKKYSESQFFNENDLGIEVNGVRNEDLEQLTFKNETFDLFITSDVMEHIYNPDKAFKEINRVLKKGGAHIFSVPLVKKHKPSEKWALKGADGEPKFIKEPEWHGNPVDKKGSPVTMHWGFDIINYIKESTQMDSEIIYINDLSYGIRAEYIEIIVTKKK